MRKPAALPFNTNTIHS